MWINIAHAAGEATRETTREGVAHLSQSFFQAVPLWIAAGIVFFVSFIVASFIKKLVIYRVTSQNRHNFNKEIILLIDRSVYFGIVLLGTIIAFKIVGINITTLIGFLGLGLGFAFKDLLANFIAGVVILTQKKFQIGDNVEVDNIIGKIVEIETRTTQIEDFDGTLHIVPNSEMLTSVVRNFTKNSFRRISFEVGVHYDTSLKEAVELTLASLKKHPEVVEKPVSHVLVTEFADSAIILEVRFWIESLAPWPLIRSAIMQQLKKDYDQANITIPFPIRTVHIDAPEQIGIMTSQK